MTHLKLSPIFRNMFDFCSYKLCDVIDDERGITLFLTCTRKTGDCPDVASDAPLLKTGILARLEISIWARR